MGARSALVMVVVGLWASAASAQDHLRPPAVLGNGSPVPPPPEARELLPDHPRPVARSLPSLHTRVALELPGWRESLSTGEGFVSQVALRPEIPGSVIVEYEGLQGYVLKHAMRRYKREWREQIEDWDEAYGTTDSELRGRYREMGYALGDHELGGRWWERRWYHSFPEARGGAPEQPFVQRVGQTVAILKVGPLSVTNEMRAELDKVALLSFDPDPGRVFRAIEARGLARDYARLDRSLADSELADSLEERRHRRREELDARTVFSGWEGIDLVLTEDRPARWLEGIYWRVKLRPKARLKLSTSSMTFKGDVRLRVLFEFFSGADREHFADLEWSVRYKPVDNELSAAVELSLLTW